MRWQCVAGLGDVARTCAEKVRVIFIREPSFQREYYHHHIWRLWTLAQNSTEDVDETKWVETWENSKGAFRGWVKANLRKWLTSGFSTALVKRAKGLKRDAKKEKEIEKGKGVEETMGKLSLSISADDEDTDQVSTVKPLTAPPQKPLLSPMPEYDQYNSPASGVRPASPPNPTLRPTPISSSKPASSNTAKSRPALTEANLTAHSGSGSTARYETQREGLPPMEWWEWYRKRYAERKASQA
ncbi:hypothetical protein HG530_014583 [Fusarium avenaceum]|nr:hypothetical protein HG530_014583 [Fusarium avenaceum]